MATRQSVARLDASEINKTAEGFLDLPVYPTRVGVFTYFDATTGERIRELRPPEEVFKADSLASLENKIFTDDHPPRLITTDTAKTYYAGHLHGPHDKASDGVHTKSRVMVTDAKTIAKIDAGKRQVSCGYDCHIDATPGVHPEWGPYDRIQRDIQYNHLSLVTRGRAGSAELKMDGDEERFDAWEIDETDQQNEVKNMVKFDVDGHEVEVSESAKIALANKFKADQTKMDGLTAAVEEAKEQAKAAKADADALQAKLDQAAEELDKYRKAEARARVDALAAKLGAVLGKDYKFSDKTEPEVKRDALAKLKPSLKLDGLSEDYIAARLDAALESAPAKSSVLDKYDAAPAPEDKTDWASRCDLFDEE